MAENPRSLIAKFTINMFEDVRRDLVLQNDKKDSELRLKRVLNSKRPHIYFFIYPKVLKIPSRTDGYDEKIN